MKYTTDIDGLIRHLEYQIANFDVRHPDEGCPHQAPHSPIRRYHSRQISPVENGFPMICLSCLYDPRYPDPTFRGLGVEDVLMRAQSTPAHRPAAGAPAMPGVNHRGVAAAAPGGSPEKSLGRSKPPRNHAQG